MIHKFGDDHGACKVVLLEREAEQWTADGWVLTAVLEREVVVTKEDVPSHPRGRTSKRH